MKKENIIASGLGSRTNRTLVATAVLLNAVVNFNDILHIPSEYINHLVSFISVVGAITGYHFRNLTAKNANGAINNEKTF